MPGVWQHLDFMALCPGRCSSALPPCANTVSFVCRLFCDPAGLMRLKNPWSVSSKAFQRHFPAQPFEVSRRRCPGARSHKHFPGGKPAGVANPSATRSCGRGHTAAMLRGGSARHGPGDLRPGCGDAAPGDGVGVPRGWDGRSRGTMELDGGGWRRRARPPA